MTRTELATEHFDPPAQSQIATMSRLVSYLAFLALALGLAGGVPFTALDPMGEGRLTPERIKAAMDR